MRRLIVALLLLPLPLTACGGGQTEESGVSSAFLSGDEDRYFNLALQQRREGNLLGAQESLNLALQANPNYLAAHLTMGDVNYELGNYDEAIESYRTCIGLRERSVEPHFGLARSYYAVEDLENARMHAERAYALSLDYSTEGTQSRMLAILGVIQLAQEDFDAAEQTLQSSLDIDSSNIEARIELARLKAETGRVRDAISMLSGVETFEEDTEILLELGRLFFEYRVFERSLEVLERGHELAPQDNDIAYLLSASYMQTANSEMAIPLASDILSRDPEYLDAYVVRGRGELVRARNTSEGSVDQFVDRARDDAEFVMSRNDQHFDALLLLGEVAIVEADNDAAIADSRLADAEQFYEQAMNVAPGNIDAINHMAELYYAQSRWAELVSLVDPYFDRPDRDPQWPEMMVSALLATGDPVRACRIQSEIADSRPSDHELHRDVARLALDNPEALSPEKTLEHARNAFERNSGTLEYRLLIVDALINVGQYEDAAGYLDVALRAWPYNPDVQEREDIIRQNR